MTDVELIKSKIDIVEFISDYIQLKKSGRNFKACCPFHNERTPSFIVSPERQTWHCFGSCSEGGDVVKFLEKYENVEFLEALEILAKRVGVVLSSKTSSDGSRLKEKLFAINYLAAEYFHYILTSHAMGEQAREYLKTRGIRKETIETFTIGYASQSWDNLYKFLTKKGYDVHIIEQAGLLLRSQSGRWYDRFRKRIIFPIRDHHGNVVAIAGRKLPPEDEKEAKYINSPETPIYIKGNTLYGIHIAKEPIKKEKKAILVEGEFDMLMAFQSGTTNVVAIKGSALTEGQVMLLKRFTENLILALDSDFAGSEAARRGIEIAEGSNLNVQVVELPFGKDPAECIEKSPHIWKEAVKQAVPIYDFIIHTSIHKHDKTLVSGKKKISEEIAPFLSKITNPIVVSHYVKYVAKELDVTEESIEQLIEQVKKRGKITPVIYAQTPKSSREELLEEYLLALIIQSNDVFLVFDTCSKIVDASDFFLPPVKTIIELLHGYRHNNKTFDIRKFGRLLSPEVAPTLDRAYLRDIDAMLSQKEQYQKELALVANAVKQMSIRRRVTNLSTQLKESEKDGNGKENIREEVRKALQELHALGIQK